MFTYFYCHTPIQDYKLLLQYIYMCLHSPTPIHTLYMFIYLYGHLYYIQVNIHLRSYNYVYLHICIYMYIYFQKIVIDIYMHKLIHIHSCICTHIPNRVYIFICPYKCPFICPYVHIHERELQSPRTYTCLHTFTYTLTIYRIYLNMFGHYNSHVPIHV